MITDTSFNDVFLDAFDRAVFVHNTVNFNFFYRTTRHGGQQDATERIAKRVTKTPFERLQYHFGMPPVRGFNLDDLRCQKVR
jgi:hypothetical protein